MGDVFITRTSETIDELAMSCVAVKNYPEQLIVALLNDLDQKQQELYIQSIWHFILEVSCFVKR